MPIFGTGVLRIRGVKTGLAAFGHFQPVSSFPIGWHDPAMHTRILRHRDNLPVALLEENGILSGAGDWQRHLSAAAYFNVIRNIHPVGRVAHTDIDAMPVKFVIQGVIGLHNLLWLGVASATLALWRKRGVQVEGKIDGGRSEVSLGRASIFPETRRGAGP